MSWPASFLDESLAFFFQHGADDARGDFLVADADLAFERRLEQVVEIFRHVGARNGVFIVTDAGIGLAVHAGVAEELYAGALDRQAIRLIENRGPPTKLGDVVD